MTKLLQPLKALNLGIGGDEVQHVIWRVHNLPEFESVKNLFVLCGTNNLNQNLSEDITDGIIEVLLNLNMVPSIWF